MSKVIVITGGIGSGKSTAVELLKASGHPTIGADQIVADIYSDLEHPTTKAVIDMYGDDIVVGSAVDRSILRTKLTHRNDYQILGSLFSRPVRSALKEFTEKQTQKYVIWEVPLATESGWTGDYQVMVYCPLEVRISRVMKRSGITRQEVLQRIELQASPELQLEHADYVLMNKGGHFDIMLAIINMMDVIGNSFNDHYLD